jgi:phosphatidate cytidylyltransferase
MTELKLRVLSGVVMIAVALGALWLGGMAFWGLAALLAVLMMVEWAQMAQASRWQIALAAVLAAALLLYGSMLTAAPVPPALISTIELTGFVAIFLAVVSFRARLGGGLLYAVLPAVALIFIREQPGQGLMLALWTLVIVWATDIGAYFAGRTIGGPKLAPRLSPNKTWAGLIGGMVAAAIVGAGIASAAGLPSLCWVAGAPLAVAAQIGDLFESWLKRRSGVKDSGKLLPGHGGVLDRLDGVVPVAVLVAACVAVGML